MSKVTESGYRPCACRDCMELAIGEPGAMCHECEDAGCPGDRECQASEAYGGEPEEPGLASEPLTGALIRARCAHAGFCIITDRAAEPTAVVERLLLALDMLDPAAFDALTRPESALLAVPDAAALDPAHAYWDSAEAQAIITALIAALNRAAPPGFIFASEADDRLGFFRC